jgi:ubiquinone/menaquinone biosynthesis C-methylase UbiE
MVGDIRETSFIDEQFSKITVFFSFMYMSKNDVVETIKEVKRILKPGGSIHIWDVNFPEEFV